MELYLNRLTEQTGMQIRNHWKDARHITPSPRPEATHAKPSHRTSSALHTPALSYSTYTLCNQNSPTFPCDYCTSTRPLGLPDSVGLGRSRDSTMVNESRERLVSTGEPSQCCTVESSGSAIYPSKCVRPRKLHVTVQIRKSTVGMEQVVHEANARRRFRILFRNLDSQKERASLPGRVLGSNHHSSESKKEYPMMHASHISMLSSWIRQVIPEGGFRW